MILMDLWVLRGYRPLTKQSRSSYLAGKTASKACFEKTTPSKPGNMTEFIGERGGRKRNNIAWATGIACFTLLYRLTASCLLAAAACCSLLPIGHRLLGARYATTQ